MQFIEWDVRPSTKNPSLNNLFLTFATVHAVQSLPNTKKETVTIQPGYRITECCTLWQPDNMETSWKVKVAKIIDALEGTDDDTRPTSYDWNTAKGKTVQVSTKAEDDPQYGLQPRIKKFSPPPAI